MASKGLEGGEPVKEGGTGPGELNKTRSPELFKLTRENLITDSGIVLVVWLVLRHVNF